MHDRQVAIGRNVAYRSAINFSLRMIEHSVSVWYWLGKKMGLVHILRVLLYLISFLFDIAFIYHLVFQHSLGIPYTLYTFYTLFPFALILLSFNFVSY